MVSTAEIIIVGAGISGGSIAYNLAAKGVKNIVVIDKENVASGATGRSSAMISPIREGVEDLAWKSVQIYQDWPQSVGGDLGFRQTGNLILVEKEPPYDIEWAEDTVKKARALGIKAEVISPEDVATMQPHFRVDDIGGAIHCTDAGHGDGHIAANTFMAEARRLGVYLMRDTKVTDIVVERGKAVGVRTAKGDTFSAAKVVLSTGAWSGPLARSAGIDIPIIPRRVCNAMLKRPPEIRSHMTIGRDWTIGTYWRMEGPDLTLVGIRNREVMPPCDPDNYPQSVTEETMSMWARRIMHRMPAMEKAGWRFIWTAPEAYMPDHCPMLGVAPAVDGLFFALAFSGGGMTMGPIYGKCVAELIADGKTTSADIHHLRPSRFIEGKSNHIPDQDEWPYPTKIDRHFP